MEAHERMPETRAPRPAPPMIDPAARAELVASATPAATIAPTSSPAPAELFGPGVGEKMRASNLNFFYGKAQALYDISIRVPTNHVTAFIGPSGCGKSTFLRTLNRMCDTVKGTRVEGDVHLDGEDIFDLDVIGSPARRHGVPAFESVSKINLRQCRVRASGERRPFAS